MRKLVLLSIAILFIAASCASPGLRFPFPDGPGIVVQLPVGGAGASPPTPPPAPVRTCSELRRVPCDVVHCPGPGYDFVVTKCAGAAASGKCVANGGCSVEGAESK